MSRRSWWILVLAAVSLITLATASVVTARPPSKAPQLVGTWVNVDKETRGIVKLNIARKGNGRLAVHSYGACYPKPCDNGTVNAFAHSTSVDSSRAKAFSYQSNIGFAVEIVTGQLEDREDGLRLVVNSFTRFTDSSSRYDFFYTDVFKLKP